jgi:hypothetical protein
MKKKTSKESVPFEDRRKSSGGGSSKPLRGNRKKSESVSNKGKKVSPPPQEETKTPHKHGAGKNTQAAATGNQGKPGKGKSTKGTGTGNAGRNPDLDREAPARAPRKGSKAYQFQQALMNGTVDPFEIPGNLPLKVLHDPPSPALTKAISLAVEIGVPVEDACRAVGVHVQAARAWLSQGVHDLLAELSTPYSDFIRTLDAAEAKSMVSFLTAINIGVRHAGTLLDLLGRRFPEKFGPKATLAVGSVMDNATASLPKEAVKPTPEFMGSHIAIMHELGLLSPPTIDVQAEEVRETPESETVSGGV